MNAESHIKPIRFDMIDQIAKIVPTEGFDPDGISGPPLASRMAVAAALGRIDLRTVLAVRQFVSAMHSNCSDHDIPHVCAMWSVTVVTEGRLFYQPAATFEDLHARLEYLMEVEKDSGWPDKDRLPCLEQAERDLRYLTHGGKFGQREIADQLDIWFKEGEAAYQAKLHSKS